MAPGVSWLALNRVMCEAHGSEFKFFEVEQNDNRTHLEVSSCRHAGTGQVRAKLRKYLPVEQDPLADSRDGILSLIERS